MLNALVASTHVIIPVQAHFYALDGLKRLLETIRVVRARFYPCVVQPLGLLLTFMEGRTLLCKRIETGMRQVFGPLVFDTAIHKNISLAEAPSAGQSVLTYAPDSRGAQEYAALAKETIALQRPGHQRRGGWRVGTEKGGNPAGVVRVCASCSHSGRRCDRHFEGCIGRNGANRPTALALVASLACA
jgi:hypothetical protein